MPDLYDCILHNQYSINILWTLLSGALVYFMQLGFAFLEAGFPRAKNATNTMALTLMVFIIGTASYWEYGFALGWGNWFNGPAAPGWYPSLGPGLSVLFPRLGNWRAWRRYFPIRIDRNWRILPNQSFPRCWSPGPVLF
jgi:Amt family ammonium transporter